MEQETNITNEKFIHSMTDIDIWNQFHNRDINDTNAKYKIELKSGQYHPMLFIISFQII